MCIRACDKEFIEFIKARTDVSLQELHERFGGDTEFLLRNHSEGGYIAIDEDTVHYVRDHYIIGAK